MVVDKCRKILNNEELAYKTFEQLYSEFNIGQDLDHQNIVEYQYFISNFYKKSRIHEFHIIQELMEGGDLNQYLKQNGPQPL